MALKRVQTTDFDLNQVQTNLIEVLGPIAANQITQGRLIANVQLITGITNIIPIGLTQPLTGWIVTRLNTSSNIWDSQNLNKTPSQNLQLLCSVNCIISLYVF